MSTNKLTRAKKKKNHEYFNDDYVFWLEDELIKLRSRSLIKSSPNVYKNYKNGQCAECELNEHKECNI